MAKKKKIPNDWCYIYNFDNPNEPIAVSFPVGQGKEFKKDMDDFINDIKSDIKGTFNNEDFEKERNLIRQEFEEQKSSLLDKLTKESLEQGFQVKTAQNGIYIMPILNGKTIEEEEFEKLDSKIKADFETKSATVQQQIIETMGQIKAMEKAIDKKVDEWQSNIALLTINVHINTMKNKYKKVKKIPKFLDNIKNDILKNLSYYITDDTSNKQNNNPMKPEQPKPWTNYKVNLFVDNSNLEGAPIIMDNNYSYTSLFGKLEYENQFGVLKTDYTMLKSGLFHQANGGFIILQAKDLLSNPLCWEALKKTLRIKELLIENFTDQRSATVLVSLKPEPIPLNVKVLLVGSSAIYHTLLSLDEDFRKLFKIKVEFEESAPRTDDNIIKIAQFVQTFCKKEEVPHLDREAMAKVIEFTSRLTEDKNKISTQFYEILEIVGEACTWAKLDKAKVVTKDYVKKALSERIERVKKYDQKYLEMIQDHTLLINTSGLKVGEINGLTIVSIGDYSFGKPSKITVNTYIGKEKIVNIEREVELSGSSHSKGIYILNGYIGEKFAQDIPLSLTASICFEQLYNGVDGDSASSTEVYALLSSLSEIPIEQSIAVTRFC